MSLRGDTGFPPASISVKMSNISTKFVLSGSVMLPPALPVIGIEPVVPTLNITELSEEARLAMSRSMKGGSFTATTVSVVCEVRGSRVPSKMVKLIPRCPGVGLLVRRLRYLRPMVRSFSRLLLLPSISREQVEEL